MSWEALNWATEQKTGSPQAKLLLLLLANRADEQGFCWPSQLGLSKESEQSDDTIQRHLKAMEGRFIMRARTRRTRGRWSGYVYQLMMPNVVAAEEDDLQEQPKRKRVAREAIRRAKAAPLPAANPGSQLENGVPTTPHRAARSTPLSAASPHRSLRLHQAAESGVEPSIEPSLEPSPAEPSPATAAAAPGLRPAARQRLGAARSDLVQSDIARRLGPDGWSILQCLGPDGLAQIEGMQRKGNLTEAALRSLRNEYKLMAMGGTAVVEAAR